MSKNNRETPYHNRHQPDPIDWRNNGRDRGHNHPRERSPSSLPTSRTNKQAIQYLSIDDEIEEIQNTRYDQDLSCLINQIYRCKTLDLI